MTFAPRSNHDKPTLLAWFHPHYKAINRTPYYLRFCAVVTSKLHHKTNIKQRYRRGARDAKMCQNQAPLPAGRLTGRARFIMYAAGVLLVVALSLCFMWICVRNPLCGQCVVAPASISIGPCCTQMPVRENGKKGHITRPNQRNVHIL